MSKLEVSYVCSSCGQGFPRWSGQCPSCDEWNTLSEELQTSKIQPQNKFQSSISKPQTPISITEVDYNIEERQSTGIVEVDRVLGGGVVAGSVVLVSGEPGIGKSTMMLQVAEALSLPACLPNLPDGSQAGKTGRQGFFLSGKRLKRSAIRICIH